MLKQMENQESIYNLHKDMLDQFDQLVITTEPFLKEMYIII